MQEEWLKGLRQSFQVITDHLNLKYLRDAQQLNPRKTQWAKFFTCFNHPELPKNTKADALHWLHSPEMSNLPEISRTYLPLIIVQDEQIVEALKNNPAPLECPMGQTYAQQSFTNSP